MLGTVHVFNADYSAVIAAFETGIDNPSAMSFSRDNNKFIVAGNNSVQILDVVKKATIFISLPWNPDGARFSNDGKKVIVRHLFDLHFFDENGNKVDSTGGE